MPHIYRMRWTCQQATSWVGAMIFTTRSLTPSALAGASLRQMGSAGRENAQSLRLPLRVLTFCKSKTDGAFAGSRAVVDVIQAGASGLGGFRDLGIVAAEGLRMPHSSRSLR